EGVLSASFIPVYAKLLAEGDRDRARQIAGAMGGLLAIATSIVVLIGILITPVLVSVFTPGFEGEKREVTIRLVRILFPGSGLLVLSAWCLGVLNSHGRFFLSYSAPVLWNVAIIAVLLLSGNGASGYRLTELAAWGAVIGSALQFGIKFPSVLRLIGRLPASFIRGATAVGTVVRNALPVLVGRGVVQVSAYVDTVLASLLPTGAVAAVTYAQVLSTLPISLFGMAVSAAELPAMSGVRGESRAVADQLRERLMRGLRQIALFVIPSAVAFLALGDVIVAALYQTGAFTRSMTLYVWGILAGSALGLLASTWGRLYSSTFYAMQDTRTPLRFAVVRVLLSILLGYLLAVPLPGAVGLEQRWGVVGLAVASSLGAWTEFLLLRRRLDARIGSTVLPRRLIARLWGGAAAAAIAGAVVKLALEYQHPVVTALFSLGMYGVAYFAITAELGVPESRRLLSRVRIDRKAKR
ncbi:MAG TPA: murein biosynthesis integral membrane protein MurJ, partial [Gemmatimonadales bacterium]|nr:murein biosynthesis integral membrane protein MurJ [Gemmatimonadales bacterium]